MNPSSSGWIHKFINEFEKKELVTTYESSSNFYTSLKKTGFIYGFSIKTLLSEPVSRLQLTKEELTKINLFHSLLFIYFSNHPKHSFSQAIDEMVAFYRTIEKGKPGFFQKLSFTSSSAENLEKIIAARLHESNTLIKTEVASLFTYALLFGDVLAFQHYLKNPMDLKDYLEMLEETLVQLSMWALQSKHKKTKYDLLVIEMISDATPYEMTSQTLSGHPLVAQLRHRDILEKLFVLDLCSLAVWDDKKLDAVELDFLLQISDELGFSEKQATESISTLKEFSVSNAQKIKLFEYAHPVRHLYKQSSETVKLLILRNKNRLLRELNESGELLKLLSHSTIRELSAEEKSKVKVQLLDVCKTIPSLTIFLLPGGSLLLPLLVKLIPKLLPSAFNENQVND
jgi:LETM1-like, RBD